MRIFRSLFGASLGALLGLAVPLRAADKVIVHEWGTFTSLQDENGNAIGGINVDDEPVPEFVLQTAVGVASQYDPCRWHNLGLPPYMEDKGWISGDPHVTLRLETPVIYFYPAAYARDGQLPPSVPPLDVHVDFRGGVLSQYYPYAKFSGLPTLKIPEQPEMDGKFPYVDKATGITEKTTTSLDWKGVRLGSTEKPIECDDKVWTTPREVSAPLLQVQFSDTDNQGPHTYTQAEHFLFYRGVGHLDSPLFMVKVPYWPSHEGIRNEMFNIWSQRIISLSNSYGLLSPEYIGTQGWLVDIEADKTCAFRNIPSIGGAPVQTTPIQKRSNLVSAFGSDDFSPDNLAELKASMQAALVKEGLYPNEASAMLRTWELSYFKSPGLRFFYIVPRAWVDKVLPLKITGAPTEITRVMVGRIELITDAQKAALQRLSDGPCPDLRAFKKAAQDALQNSKLPKDEVDAFYRGEKPLSELGITIPPLIQDYLSLGRFRDALVMEEFWKQKSMPLAQFINQNQIAPEGVEIKGRDLVPLPPSISLKNPGPPPPSGLHL